MTKRCNLRYERGVNIVVQAYASTGTVFLAKALPTLYNCVQAMGSGRDKRKKAKPKAPGAGADKTSRKTEKNADKAVKRATKAAQVNPCWHQRFAVVFLNEASSIHYDT